MPPDSLISTVLKKESASLLSDWMKEQMSAETMRADLIKENELREQSDRFLKLMREATDKGGTNIRAPEWEGVRQFLTELSRNRASLGFSPSETATFVLSMKQPLFARLRLEHKSAEALADDYWALTLLVDKLALYTTESYQQVREDVIRRQQEEMLELSTPVVTLWEGVLALPMIGTLDSARTQVVMESLLQRIVETGSEIAIIDITGVPTVDTLVAQHLLKTVAAARLMGADCIISGIRPQIAQTMVHLAIDLTNVTTKASLADAFAVALKRLNLTVERVKHNGAASPEARAAGKASNGARPAVR